MMSRSQTEKDLQGEQPRWGWGISWCKGLVGMEKRRIEVGGVGRHPWCRDIWDYAARLPNLNFIISIMASLGILT